MSEYNHNENLNNGYEPEISNKTTLDKEKIIDRILISVLIVFCIVLTILGIDIEKKLKIINEKEPVVISEETTMLTSGTSALTEIIATEEATTTNVSVTEVSSEVISTTLEQTTREITTDIAVTGENTQQQTTETATSSTNLTSAQTTLASTTQVSTAEQTAFTAEKITTTKPQHDGKYYITASGKKYHRSTCSYLSKTKIEIDFDEAQDKGYSPCSRCIEQ